MTLREVASQYRLRGLKRDECRDLNIVGRRGAIYDYCADGLFCVAILDAPNAAYWNKWRLAFIATGCRITQNGETEGTALFDPANSKQAQTATQAIRTYRRRTLSTEHRLKAIEALSSSKN